MQTTYDGPACDGLPLALIIAIAMLSAGLALGAFAAWYWLGVARAAIRAARAARAAARPPRHLIRR